MPRPRKSDDEARSKVIAFRVTPSEYATLEVGAERAGLRPNEYARQVITEGEVRIEFTEQQSVDPAIIKRIDRIALNVNQLVKNAHIFKRVSPHLEPLCREIREIVFQAVERRVEE